MYKPPKSLLLSTWTYGLAILFALPFLGLIYRLLVAGDMGAWSHIITGETIGNTFLLLCTGGLVSLILGIVSAYACFRLPQSVSRYLFVLLLIPLASPPFITAIYYAEVIAVETELHRWLQSALGFELKSLTGLGFIYGIGLYPYVLFPVYLFLQKHGDALNAVSQNLQIPKWKRAVKILLPGVLFHSLGGISLVFVEVLNDYGAAVYFGVPTLSTAIFKVWFVKGDFSGATVLSWILVSKAIILFLLLKWWQKYRRMRYEYPELGILPGTKDHSRKYKWLIPAVAIGLIAAVVPFSGMLGALPEHINPRTWQEWRNALLNTLWLNGLIAFAIVGVSALSWFMLRYYGNRKFRTVLNLGNLGYAIPGAVMAMAVLPLFIQLDRSWLQDWGWLSSQSLSMIMVALFIRYFAIGNQFMASAMETTHTQLESSARNLGAGFRKTFLKVLIPVFKTTLFGAFVTTWIDLSKELPITLILRPFNFHTLATRTFAYAEDEFLGIAAIFGLTLVGFAILPFMFLRQYRTFRHAEH